MTEYLLCFIVVHLLLSGEDSPYKSWPHMQLMFFLAFLLWVVLKVAIWAISGVWNWIDFSAIFQGIFTAILAAFGG